MFDGKKILVTGGAGFIGSNIVEYLLTLPTISKVRVLDNFSTGYKKNLENFRNDNKFEFIEGDISNMSDCYEAIKDINIVCHQAALGSVPRSVNDPLSSHISNVDGFLKLLTACKEMGIKRIVYASSSSVYGDDENLPKIENKTGNVMSPYAATKFIDEIYANVFSFCYDMEIIGLRYFNIFGKRQDPNGAYAAVIPKFINRLKIGEKPVINGDGSFSRDFTHVENAVNANVLAMNTDNSNCFGNVYNIGAGGQTSILELFNVIKEKMNVNIDPIFGSYRKGDVPHSNASIEKAKSHFGYEPHIGFDYGLKKTVEYFLNVD
jgi:UDP-N-acetylglucosamine 4-epimerase